MTLRYKKVKDPVTDTVQCIKKWDDAQSEPIKVSLIPLDENNTDYQEWQEWDAIDGNTTEDAD